jgi:membrane-bound ClpP family serine protease
MSFGIFGIYTELCRPGRAIPGALGSASLLIGLASLLRFPIAPLALLCLTVAVALLVLEALVASRGFLTLMAAGAMLYGVRTLIGAPDPTLQIRWATAAGAALSLTFATGFLMSAAVAARRGKAFTRRTIS